MNFIVKRIISALVTLFLVSVFCFLAFSVIRGDPASMALGVNATAEQLAALRSEMGLDRNLGARYLRWLGNFFSGNWGYSARFQGEAVADLVRERLPVSFALAFFSLLLVVLIAAPLSLFTARRENGIADKLMNAGTAAGISMPNFFLGALLIWVFGITLRWFSPGVYVDYRDNAFGFLSSLFFPALAIAIPNAAVLAKFLRSSLFREQRSDYARTARSKGAPAAYTLRRHALRNALIPSITVLGMIIAEVLSGSIVIEQVFAIPGIGRLLIAAITSRDYPLIQTLVVYIALIVIIANTLVDIVIQTVDPRIRLEAETAQ